MDREDLDILADSLMEAFEDLLDRIVTELESTGELADDYQLVHPVGDESDVTIRVEFANRMPSWDFSQN